MADKINTFYSFVIIRNHIHLIWQALTGNTLQKVQASFMKFTAKEIKLDLQKNHSVVLEKFKVNAADRKYQFLERNPLGIELYTNPVFMQKLEYIYLSTVKAGFYKLPEEYYYSSAKFYFTGINEF